MIIFLSFLSSNYVKANDFISKINDDYIINLLELKANEVILSGNVHKSENNYLQAKTINPAYNKSLYSESDENSRDESIDYILKSNEFIHYIRSIPYKQAKLELDKKLFFYPNNLSLKLIFLKLAFENNDEQIVSKILEDLKIKADTPEFTNQNSNHQQIKSNIYEETNIETQDSSTTYILENKNSNNIEEGDNKETELPFETNHNDKINYGLSIKYFLAIVIICLIIREIKIILKSRVS